MRVSVRNLLILCLAPLLAACDDDGTRPNQLTRADVAGVFSVCQLVFTPTGAQPQVDVLARGIATEVRAPELRVNPTGEIQFAFTPSGEFVEQNIRGVFQIQRGRVVLDFTETGTRTASALLLPDPLRLEFQPSPRVLSVQTTAPFEVPRATFARLAGISEAGLAPTIPGTLAATFREGACV